MSDSDQRRTQGVEFGPLVEKLENAEYPMDKEAVVAEFGDEELGLEDEDTTVRKVLEPQGETTYESADEVEQAILNMVGDDAVGREDYTDRGGHTEGPGEQNESL